MQVTSVFPSLTVYENVWLGVQRTLGRPSAIRRRDGIEEVAARAHECLELAGITGRAHEPAGSIGHGDQRLLEIAIALALRPKLLLLDEPTAGMSVKESWEIVRRLREIRVRDRLTVVIVEHDMEIVMSRRAHHRAAPRPGAGRGTPDEIARTSRFSVHLTGR
jgi:branched-chain amino acid transport system ATP-binding protein